LVSLHYAESLWLPGKREKGNRDEVEGKTFFGNPDVFRPDGGAHRMFRPLWWRTYRYVELSIETQGDPIIVEDFQGVYTAIHWNVAPASKPARKNWPGSWTSAGVPRRLCAHETYMDCPYYEQLQYGGDTRIQGLVSLYMTGDGRLIRNAIEQLNASRTGDDMTLGCAPSVIRSTFRRSRCGGSHAPRLLDVPG